MRSVKLCILIETLVGTLVTINSVTITFGQVRPPNLRIITLFFNTRSLFHTG